MQTERCWMKRRGKGKEGKGRQEMKNEETNSNPSFCLCMNRRLPWYLQEYPVFLGSTKGERKRNHWNVQTDIRLGAEKHENQKRGKRKKEKRKRGRSVDNLICIGLKLVEPITLIRIGPISTPLVPHFSNLFMTLSASHGWAELFCIVCWWGLMGFDQGTNKAGLRLYSPDKLYDLWFVRCFHCNPSIHLRKMGIPLFKSEILRQVKMWFNLV